MIYFPRNEVSPINSKSDSIYTLKAGVRARKLVPSETCEKKEEGKMNDGKKEREEKKLN